MRTITNLSSVTDSSGTYYSNPVVTYVLPKPIVIRYFYDLRRFCCDDCGSRQGCGRCCDDCGNRQGCSRRSF